MSRAAEPALEARRVSRTYGAGSGAVRALQDVSIRVEAQEYVALMGRSGSGKSTFLNIAGLLDRPDSGEIRISGLETTALSRSEAARLRNRLIGFVFQQYMLLPRLTALENVELPLLYADLRVRERRARASEALARVGLLDRADHRPSELSGGQQQRVALARAVVTRPRLLLADEPTGALDEASSRLILDDFDRLRRESGAAIVLVTHDPLVASRAQRVVRFIDGRAAPPAAEPQPS